MCSAVQRHQSAERLILHQISSLMYPKIPTTHYMHPKIQRRQVIMDVLHPGCARRRFEDGLASICVLIHSCKMPTLPYEILRLITNSQDGGHDPVLCSLWSATNNCQSYACAMQKRINRSRCHLGHLILNMFLHYLVKKLDRCHTCNFIAYFLHHKEAACDCAAVHCDFVA